MAAGNTGTCRNPTAIAIHTRRIFLLCSNGELIAVKAFA